MSDGPAFRVVKHAEPLIAVGVITREELERPSCRACYRPGQAPYCAKCEGSGAAARHATHPHRMMEPAA